MFNEFYDALNSIKIDTIMYVLRRLIQISKYENSFIFNGT